MKIQIDALNSNTNEALEVILHFNEAMSIKRDKHVMSMHIDDNEYYFYINNLTHAINAIIADNDAAREEAYNDVLELDE